MCENENPLGFVMYTFIKLELTHFGHDSFCVNQQCGKT